MDLGYKTPVEYLLQPTSSPVAQGKNAPKN
jgi:hypothetical protein